MVVELDLFVALLLMESEKSLYSFVVGAAIEGVSIQLPAETVHLRMRGSKTM